MVKLFFLPISLKQISGGKTTGFWVGLSCIDAIEAILIITLG